MKFINLTPHELNLLTDEVEIKIAPEGVVARAEEKQTLVDTIDGVPVYQITYGEVVDLPEPVEGVAYIVSSITAQAVVGRNDIYVPAAAVRDGAGRIVGCKGLAKIESKGGI